MDERRVPLSGRIIFACILFTAIFALLVCGGYSMIGQTILMEDEEPMSEGIKIFFISVLTFVALGIADQRANSLYSLGSPKGGRRRIQN